MVGLLLSIVASIVPTVAYVSLVWWLDRYEKEPLRLLVMAFAWGALPAALLSIAAELALAVPLQGLGQSAADLVSAGAIAPAVEEIFKAAMLVALVWRHRDDFDGVLDGIVYGGLIGFGFAMTENFIYFVGSWLEGGVTTWSVVVFLRVVLFGLNHAFFTAITGAGLGYARLSRPAGPRLLIPPLALALAIIFHAGHNFLAAVGSEQPLAMLGTVAADWAGVVMVLAVVRMSWRDEAGWLVRELADEAAAGVISAADYDSLVSRRRRVGAQLRALSGGGLAGLQARRRTYQLAARLAFKKHQVRTLGEETGVGAEIAALRAALLAGHEA